MVRITWLGHSSFQLVLASGETYLLDPWIDGNPKYPAAHVIARVDGETRAAHGTPASRPILALDGLSGSKFLHDRAAVLLS